MGDHESKSLVRKQLSGHAEDQHLAGLKGKLQTVARLVSTPAGVLVVVEVEAAVLMARESRCWRWFAEGPCAEEKKAGMKSQKIA